MSSAGEDISALRRCGGEGTVSLVILSGDRAMSTIADPNWLAVSASLFAMCGTGFLVNAFVKGDNPSTDTEARNKTIAERDLSIAFGVPLLGIGVLLHAVSQIAHAHLSPLITSMLLALAFLLLMFLALDDLLIDAMRQKNQPRQKTPKLALIAPPSPAPAVESVAAAEPQAAEPAVQSKKKK